MTAFPAEMPGKIDNVEFVKALELISVGKKYALAAGQINKKAAGEDFWALKDVSLDVARGKILGVVGRNGAGKTTLLNIISGVFAPSEGKIISQGRVLGLFNLGVGFQDEFTGRENIFLNGAVLGASRKELNAKLNKIIEFSELGSFIDMPLGTYSQGMRLRLAFSIIANLDFATLVMDEVLAVGDALFQSKCFQRLMDFKRTGKTLIITTQSMDLIERLCDKVVLMDHGRLLFEGNAIEAINKYSALLNTEKFFVGPQEKNIGLIENTKKWVDDISEWGKEFGTKEVLIESVEFINKWGLKCEKVNSGEPLKIKARFKVKNKVKRPHFGIAIFRKDGVYCYGPNTKFDGYEIPELNPGNGYFVLNLRNLSLAPGDYHISVAVWDKNETLAFDYHAGFHKLTVAGYRRKENELLNIPFKFYPKNYLSLNLSSKCSLSMDILSDMWGKKIENDMIVLESVGLYNNLAEKKDVFFSNEYVKIAINFSKLPVVWNCINKVSLRRLRAQRSRTKQSPYYLWIGLYRDDGVYCQGTTQPLRGNMTLIVFPKLTLLPGGYKVSLGIWDNGLDKFLMCHHAVYSFRMIFNRQDHGTVYLKHNWVWSLPWHG